MFDSTWTLRRREPDLLKGAVAGLLSGLAASWVRNQFQAAAPATTFRRLLGETDGGEDRRPEPEGSDEGAEPATVQAAEAVSEGVLGHRLTDDE